MKDLHAVKNKIPADKFSVEEARLEYIPTTFVDLNEIQSKSLENMFDKLEEKEFVTRIYDNFALTSNT